LLLYSSVVASDAIAAELLLDNCFFADVKTKTMSVPKKKDMLVSA
jgi:hypothetical protein